MERKKLIILIIIVVAAVVLAFFAAPWFFALIHESRLKQDLNNPVINSGYKGWHELSLDENISIKFPDGWTLIRQKYLMIKNEQGDIIAVGKKTGMYSQDQLEDALGEHYGEEVKSFERIHEVNGRYPYFGNNARVQIHITEMNGGNKTKQVFVYLPHAARDANEQYAFCFAVFADDDSKDYTELIYAAEAIAWSLSD